MLSIIGNRKIILSVLTMVLLIYGVQGVSYGQAAPDLAVSTPTFNPTTVALGGSFTLSVTVTNWGGAQSTGTQLIFYRSADNIIGTGDEFVGSNDVPPLATLGRYGPTSVSLTAPTTRGTYYYIAYVVPVDGENNRDNNSGAAQLRFTPEPTGPDLTVSAPTFDPTPVAPGGSFTFSVTVTNQGRARSTETPLIFYRSEDSTIVPGDDSVVGSDIVPALAINSSQRFTISSLTAPATRGTTYYYGAYVVPVSDENNTGNNVVGAQLPVTQTVNRPNLTVSVYSSSSTVAPNTLFRLTAIVTNNGTAQSAATSVQAYLSSNRVTDSPVSIPQIVPIISHVSPNNRRTVSISNVRAPATSGTYYYRVQVDPSNTVAESNETDNYSAYIGVTVTNPPDLTVDTPTVDKSALAPSESFTLSTTVRNNGRGISAATTLRYHRSTDTTLGDDDDTEVGTDAIAALGGFLSGSTTYTSAQNITLTAPSNPGDYYYYVSVDPVSGEGITYSNRSAYVKITVAAPPDLVVDIFRPRQSIFAPGESFTLDATVRNQGSGTSTATILRYYQNTDNRLTRQTEVRRVSVSAISINSSSSKSITLIAPSAPGIYYYQACVDTVTNETSTDNNCSSYIAITVTQPLTIDSFQPNKFALTAGERFTLTATVRNDGDERSTSTTLLYYRSSNDSISPSDTFVGRSTISALSARSTIRVGISINAPGTSGSYYYGACIGDVGTSGGDCSVVKITVVNVVLNESQRPPMYWVDADVGALQSLTGPRVSRLVPTVQNANSVVVDTAGGQIYWAEQTSSRTGSIRRANLNGTNVQLVKNLTSVPRGLALDTSNNKLYLTNAWGKVQRMNRDGTGFQPDLIRNLDSPRAVAVDAAGGKVYWTEESRIRRANLNGTNIQLVREFTSTVNGLAIDAHNNKLYLANSVGKVQRLNLDGTGFQPDLITNLDSPTSVAIDAAGDKVYWTENGRIRRANLNGTNVQNVATGLGSPVSIVLSAAPVEVLISQSQRAPIYWHTQAGTLQRLTAASVQGIVPAAQNATGIAVDARAGKVYWVERTSSSTGRIRRANLNGSNVQLVKELTSVPRGLAIDVSNGKLYLTNAWGKVQSLNLDGTGFQPNLIVNLASPMGVAVDAAGGKVYWTEQTGDSSGRVRRANLDGKNVQLVRALATSVPHGLAVDASNGKLYLTNSRGKVQRLNLDGTGFQPDLIVNQNSPQGVAVDVAARKVYWTERSSIRRANLDGTNIQNVVRGLGGPAGIALGVVPVNTRAAAAPAAAAAIPKETALHPNYPNPFNPETWIPYQLQKPADVQISIYNQSGVLVRELSLGYQEAGQYVSRSRAAYWDGRNQVGEPVASGIYFYTLTAEDFSATRKMLILK